MAAGRARFTQKGGAGRASVRVQGIRETQAALAAYPEAVRVGVADAIRSTVHRVHAGARAAVPRRTGALAQSVSYWIRKDGLRAIVGSPLYYSVFVELGTRRTRPRPFLFPAFLAGVRQFRADIKGIAAGDLKLRTRLRRRRVRR